ncbi:MAG: hypothetical protein H0V12_05835 [Chloroflexi bacterium]|nr:hypothetical protein [Chloroflexota bacterium]
MTLNVLSFSGEDLQNLPQGQDPATAEFFERMNAEPEDVSFAFATIGILSDVVVNVIAFQIDGADSDQLIGTYIEAAEETTTAGLDTEAATVAGKDVVFATNNDAPPPFNTFYLYGYEDVLFFVQTADDAVAEEAISLLP